MARIRSVKPEFFRSKRLAKVVPPLARLTFLGIMCHADDSGIIEDDVDLIASYVWLRDPEIGPAEVAAHLEWLAAADAICRYTPEGGTSYLHVVGWDDKACEWGQAINRSTKSRLPSCPRDHGPQDVLFSRAEVANSVNTHGARKERSIQEEGRRKKEEGSKDRRDPQANHGRKSVHAELTDAYYAATGKLANWVGANQIIRRAVSSGHEPEQVLKALLSLIEQNRPLTGETLRVALNGGGPRAGPVPEAESVWRPNT